MAVAARGEKVGGGRVLCGIGAERAKTTHGVEAVAVQAVADLLVLALLARLLGERRGSLCARLQLALDLGMAQGGLGLRLLLPLEHVLLQERRIVWDPGWEHGGV
jgi:hypothetical protein